MELVRGRLVGKKMYGIFRVKQTEKGRVSKPGRLIVSLRENF